MAELITVCVEKLAQMILRKKDIYIYPLIKSDNNIYTQPLMLITHIPFL